MISDTDYEMYISRLYKCMYVTQRGLCAAVENPLILIAINHYYSKTNHVKITQQYIYETNWK